MEAVQNGAFYHATTLRERMWRRLGYRYHLGRDPDGIEGMSGWMVTETRLHFGLADRLRLLFSGRLYMRLTQHTTVQVEGTKNRFDWQIIPPGETR